MILLLVATLATTLPPQTPAPDTTAPAVPTALAARAAGVVRIDGRLDEASWNAATPITSFTQRDPNAGSPSTERTEVRILYDGDAVYVGARLFDSAGRPGSRLGRRDSELDGADWFFVAFDSYHDHLTAFQFAVNPAGVRRDAKIGDDEDDESWDPVWDASATVDASGWTAEMRIPLSQLRFRTGDEQTWGIQLIREIARNNEVSWFAFVPKRERSGVARYGHLTGLRGLAPGGRLELLPYIVGRARFQPRERDPDATFANPYADGSEQTSSLGFDLKYRLGSNLTLDATVNPDFGQVEVDPAVVNLTAFETRFEERRPFFIEGSEIFQFSGTELFYSRRVGAPPPGRPPSGSLYDDMPESSTILTAAKLTGKARGWSLAVLDALTDREEASYIDDDRVEGRAQVAPFSNYFVGRARRELREGQSVLGGMVTGVHRNLGDAALASRVRSRAFSGGADFTHDWSDRQWSLSGFFAASHIAGSRSVIAAAQRSSARYFQRPDATSLSLDTSSTTLNGYAGRLAIERAAGEHWRGDAAVSTLSPGFETNDIGFQSRADRHSASLTIEYVHEEPGRVLREWNIEAGPQGEWNYDGDRIGTGIDLEGSAEFRNYWRIDAELGRNFSSLDDRLTRGGPLVRRPGGMSASFNVETDSRKAWTFEVEGDTEWGRAGSSTSVGLDIGYKPAPNWSVSVSPEWSQERTDNQFVTSVADPLASSTFGRRYVFAHLEQSEIAMGTNVNVTFSPLLSLEVFARPFLGSGTFGGLKELTRPRAFDFASYDRTGTVTRDGDELIVDPDGAGPAEEFEVDDETFTTRSLRGSAVLRWEWRPGSTLFLVWQQQRELEDGRGNVRLGRDLRDLGRTRPDNVFVVKLTWWVNP